MKKLLFLISFLLLIIVLYLFSPARHYLSTEGFSQLQSWIQDQGIFAPLIFGLIYIIATILSLPGSVLTMSGGLLFGVYLGTAISLISATIGATGAFIVARYFGRDFVERILKGKLAKLDVKIQENGFYTVLYLRLVPLFPFNILNYSLGLTKVSLRDYFLGSLIGMAPGCFVYTSLGSVGRHASLTDLSTWADYHVWGPFLLVILLSTVPKFLIKGR